MTAPIYGLTPAMADCARVIAALTDFEGNSPSYEEIAAELCVCNKSRVYTLVQALIERGWIETRDPDLASAKWALYFNPPRAFPIPAPHRGLKLTRSPPPFDYSAIAITEAGRAYLEKAA